MSGWVASTRSKSLPVAIIACGMLIVAGRIAVAEDDLQKTDTRKPVPPDTPRRQAYEKLKVDKDRAMYAAIEDFKPVASQDKNPREYDAWIELVLHASQQKTRELEDYAARDLTPLDLNKEMKLHRTELVRFDGKLSCVRRLVPPPLLQVAGITELYEARFVPLDESPLTPVSIVFIDLPESLAEVKKKKPEEWLDADGWITASGYFFKSMSVPGERGNAVVSLPLLIGKGITPLTGPPALDGNPMALDKSLRVFDSIKDDATMANTTWGEVAAYNRVVLHAARFSAEEMEKYARSDLKFVDLFEPSRIDYKLSAVKLEGRLIRLTRIEVNETLKAAGVKDLFEGWLIPATEPRGNPVCIVFTEPLEGVEPNGRVNKWVSFAGYSFKLMRYESAEKYEDDPKRNKVKKAPLLIGRSPIARPDPDTVVSPVTWGVFMRAVVGGGVFLILAGGVLTWWYRGGDRKAKQQMNEVRGKNPFDASTM